MPTVMPRSHVAIEYVHSRVIQYHSQVVDLRWSVSIHSCEVCPFQLSDAKGSFECQAVHYGICTPVRRSLLRHPARQQLPQKPCLIDIPVRSLQGMVTCRQNESSAIEPLTVVHNHQATDDEDGTSFLLQKRVELLRKREQERKQQRIAILQPDSQHSTTSAAGVTRPTITSGSLEASLSPFVLCAPPKLPISYPAPSTSITIIAQVTTIATSAPVTSMPFAPVTALNSATTSVFSSSHNGFLSHSDSVSGATPSIALPCRPFGASSTCIAPTISHNCLTVGVTPSLPTLASTTPYVVVTSVNSTSTPLTSPLSPISSLISELETLSIPNYENASSHTNSVRQSTNLISGNIADSFHFPRDVNENRVGSERFTNNDTGQTLIPKDSLQLELIHSIPQFYFPGGSSSEAVMFTDVLLSQVTKVFEKVDGKINVEHMGLVAKACGLPLFWKYPLFHYAGGEHGGTVSLQSFHVSWKKLSEGRYDFASLFVHILAQPDRNYLEFDDFVPFIQDVVNTHPGLAFLEDAVEFHPHYIQTVVARIFYSVNRSWSGQITRQEIRKSNLLQTICRLEEEEDINQVVDYFSYEHFYVIYCKFWEIDLDHDFLISRQDLMRHNDQAINSQIVDRIFSGAVTRNLVDGKLSFPDFVWFLLAEEDKRHPRSVEYWFRCMDVDGDGVLSMYELECFYMEQAEKMDALGIDMLPFCDCLCQMLDMIRPKEEGKIRLSDLKSCALAPTFFDTFINLDKYLEREQRDPFTSLRYQIGDHFQTTDWERFAADEYEMLLAENNSSDCYQEETQVRLDRLPMEPSHTEQQSLISSIATEPLRILSNKPIISHSHNISYPEETVSIMQSMGEIS